MSLYPNVFLKKLTNFQWLNFVSFELMYNILMYTISTLICGIQRLHLQYKICIVKISINMQVFLIYELIKIQQKLNMIVIYKVPCYVYKCHDNNGCILIVNNLFIFEIMLLHPFSNVTFVNINHLCIFIIIEINILIEVIYFLI